MKLKHKIISFYSDERTKILLENENNVERVVNILKVSKVLIRPTILKLIQDIQEKIFFKINKAEINQKKFYKTF